MKKIFCLILFSILSTNIVYSAETPDKWKLLVGSAFLENTSYDVLQRITDEAGPRLPGTEFNERALEILTEELAELNLNAERETFSMPGWFRGDDKIRITVPFERSLRAVALGYVDKTPLFNAPLIYAGHGFAESFSNNAVLGKIVLVTSERPAGKKAPMRFEIIHTAAEAGARAVLFINSKKGNLVMAGTASFSGTPTSIPAYSLSYEEGQWLKRLLNAGHSVKMEIETLSYCKKIESSNLLLSFPGKVSDKIVIGAHIDSWDLSQGGIDNGLGSAVLYETARLISSFYPENYYSIELVWFNAEELGLFGAKAYMDKYRDDKIAAMINMDMIGSPTGFNVMGFENFIPFFENLHKKLNAFEMNRGVINRPWTNSDHMPFLLNGIPTFTLTAHLDDEQVKFYHSSGDSFDKVRKKYLSEAAAVVSIMLCELANNRDLPFNRLSPEKTQELLKNHKLEERLKRQGEWIFE